MLLLHCAAVARLMAQCPDGRPPDTCAPRSRVAPPNSIAVLPLENLSPDSSDAYLGVGLTEEIIARLASVSRLEVRSRFESRRAGRTAGADPAALGRSLNAAYLLSGTVSRSQQHVRVRLELTVAAARRRVWGDMFEAEGGDLLDVESAIATAVAEAVAGRLTGAERSTLSVRPTQRAAAHQAYLAGRYQWGLRTPVGLVRASELFQRAVAYDSLYAQAWAGLADTYALLVNPTIGVAELNRDSILTLAEQAASAAVALDSNSGEAWTSYGRIQESRSRWPEALRSFERAVSLSPSYPTAHLWYGYDLLLRNRWREAAPEIQRAYALDPGSAVSAVSLAAVYAHEGNWGLAGSWFGYARSVAPDNPLTADVAFLHALQRHDYSAAAREYTSSSRPRGLDSALARRIAEGLTDSATRTAALRQLARTSPEPVLPFIVTQLLDGDSAAVAYLESLPQRPISARMNPVLLAPFLGALRTHPRVLHALESVGFPPLGS